MCVFGKNNAYTYASNAYVYVFVLNNKYINLCCHMDNIIYFIVKLGVWCVCIFWQNAYTYASNAYVCSFFVSVKNAYIYASCKYMPQHLH